MAVLADPAVDVIEEILKSNEMDGSSRALRFRVAQDVLDRAGLKHVQQIDANVYHMDPRDFTDAQLDAALKLQELLAKRS